MYSICPFELTPIMRVEAMTAFRAAGFYDIRILRLEDTTHRQRYATFWVWTGSVNTARAKRANTVRTKLPHVLLPSKYSAGVLALTVALYSRPLLRLHGQYLQTNLGSRRDRAVVCRSHWSIFTAKPLIVRVSRFLESLGKM
jgi:hypothetical protein